MSLTLLDWRRRVQALYAEVRGAPDPAQAHQTWQAGRDDLLADHPDSPLLPEDREGFTGVPVAPYRPELRFEVAMSTEVEPARIEVPTATDGVVPFDLIGRVDLDGVGSLGVWWLGSYGGGLFVPVKDALAGRETYGGGRYLIDTVKGADLGGDVRDGVLVIDLNFAYNPSCAYDPAWMCPLAQPVNTVTAELRAGELTLPKAD